MRKQALIVAMCAISPVASAQEWKGAVDKWRVCADAAAARCSKSAESAPVVARLAALACETEKNDAHAQVAKSDGASFADQYIESAERYYVDRLSVKVIEMRLSH